MAECLNCGAALTGPFCAQCGQKDVPPRPSFLRLLDEVTASLFHADSRLWRTMGLLLLRPGRLPRLYLEGKRAQFLPPVRLYLATSLIFFMLLSISGGLPVEFDPVVDAGDEAAVQAILEDESVSDRAKAQILEARERLQASVQRAEEMAQTEIEDKAEVTTADESSADISLADLIDDCNINYSGYFKEFMQPRLRHACQQAKMDNGQTLLREFRGYVPTAMFLAMPFFALCMKLWFWRPRRYFVEHLLVQLFNHSAFFIVGSVARLGGLLLPLRWNGWLDLLVFAYLFMYAYTSLRVYYGQGRRLTLFKFVSLGFVYTALMLWGFVFAGLATVI